MSRRCHGKRAAEIRRTGTYSLTYVLTHLFARLSDAVGFAVDDGDVIVHDPWARDCCCVECIADAERAARRRLEHMHQRCVICGGLLTCWQQVTHWGCRG